MEAGQMRKEWGWGRGGGGEGAEGEQELSLMHGISFPLSCEAANSLDWEFNTEEEGAEWATDQ